jgi:hypothetical protein
MMNASGSKIIHAGTVLKEGTPVSDYGVADADMFVAMVNEAATALSVDAAPKPVARTAPARKRKAPDAHDTSDDGDANTSLIMTLDVGPHPHNGRLAAQEPHTQWVCAPTAQPDGKKGAGKMGDLDLLTFPATLQDCAWLLLTQGLVQEAGALLGVCKGFGSDSRFLEILAKCSYSACCRPYYNPPPTNGLEGVFTCEGHMLFVLILKPHATRHLYIL